MGYPQKDPKIDASALSRVFEDTYGILRLQPGEIVDEDLVNGNIIHNCFTAVGNGRSALIDVQTGEVLGIHFAGFFNPGSRD
jgi:hypothetical protein